MYIPYAIPDYYYFQPCIQSRDIKKRSNERPNGVIYCDQIMIISDLLLCSFFNTSSAIGTNTLSGHVDVLHL